MQQRQVPMTSAGGYDWLTIWRDMYDREKAQAEARDLVAPQSDCWQGQATRLAKAWQRYEQPDSLMQFLLPHLRPSDTVLDIGAGSGRYALYLARMVQQVIALEPSASMREQLLAALANHSLPIEVRDTAWPAPLDQPVAVAFAAHVLYGVREVAPFIAAMDAVAQRLCVLALGVQHPSAYVSPFWERFYGEPRLPLPGALECLNVLHQLGYPAHLMLIDRPGRVTFASRDDALADLRWRLRMAASAENDAAILRAIDELLPKDADGRLVPPGQLAHMAVVWWEKN
jgi:SAM-dependent methyltransferase